MAIVYKITNKLNGKIYIGKSKYNKADYFGSGLKINYALDKYGVQNFIKEIIEVCDDSVVDEIEKFWISQLHATDNEIGYNISAGGQGGDHYWKTLTEEEQDYHREKIRKGVSTRRNRLPHSEETKRKMSKNQNQTPEIKEKRAQAKRKEYIVVDHFKKIVYTTINIQQFCNTNDCPHFSRLRYNERNKKTLCDGRWSCRLKHEYTMNDLISYIEQEVIDNTNLFKQQMIGSRRRKNA